MNTAFQHQTVSRAAVRYTGVAIVLHWAIALMILSMIPMGWWMVRALKKPETQQLAYQLFQIHKSIGFAILALTVLRIVWRATHKPPALPSGMKLWERFLANATHIAFYGLMLILPLTGWIYVSSGWAIATDRPLDVATSWFGLFPIPHLPGLEGNRSLAFGAMGAHSYMAYGGAVLIALHVAAALKHQFIERDGVLAQMVPFLRAGKAAHGTSGKGKTSGLSHGFGLALVVMAAAIGWVLHLPPPLAEQPSSVEAQAEPTTTTPQSPASASQANPAQTDVQTAPVQAATAPVWVIDMASSSIGFGGTHAGNAFNGRFEEWSGDIRFDPANLPGSKAVILVKTASARTGDATQEGSLKNGEWLNSTRFPEAKFETTEFRALGGDRYEAKGTLSIKNKPLPVVLPFTLKMEGNKAQVDGALELDRAALNLGMFSDPSAEWVSKTISVKIAVSATKSDS
ncbi:hydrogenase [Agrobacterium vitis]|uniref:Hydrogenase n=1 Tax=Agrobacterium vitis TaxID=373 RepID=A0A368NXT9_AGRVI|nr:cytochrome b/b6 domain-containing protein [Agrobacterium vitis]KAA3514841.1 hydrogenase [Agrobacterium vitis]KAA3528363.1 hydrogenase [Agrobacterium vitis]MUZ97787.1 hydrogenase [Agrobacterium vitis]MVA31043.1 hydrogenase [Agrobacterium vitis]NOJ35668.1 hydrogenase [Agrobacterium vitis]